MPSVLIVISDRGGGELLCPEMSEHYLKVYTDKGHHILFMRFKDALAQLENVTGLQTHRLW